MILSESMHNGRRVITTHLNERGQNAGLFGDAPRRRKARARRLTEAKMTRQDWLRYLKGEPTAAEHQERLVWVARLLGGRHA
jgi:hypothetical protein